MSVEQYDENLLLGYVEGELTAEDAARVEAWAADDARLAGLLASMRADRAALSNLPDPPTPEWLMDEVDRQLERAMLVDVGPRQFAETAIAQRHIMRRIVLGTAVAAMLMVVVGVVISSLTGVGGSPDFAMNGEPRTPESDPAAIAPAVTDPAATAKATAPAPVETETPPAVAVTEPAKPDTTPTTPTKAGETEPAKANTQVVAKAPDSSAAPGGDLVPVMPNPKAADTAPAEPPVAAKTGPEESAVAKSSDPAAPSGPSMLTPAGPAQVLADSGAPRHADLLPLPPLKHAEAPNAAPEARLPADDALYNARQIRLQPDLARQMELRIVAQDPEQVVQQITAFVNRTPETEAPATGSITKADLQQAVAQILQQADSTPSQQYQLHVNPEQLPTLIAELQAAPGKAQVQLRPRNLLAVGKVPDKAPPKSDVSLTPAPWPTLAPDYRAILQQQIPQPPRKDQPATGLVDLPLIIQKSPPVSDR